MTVATAQVLGMFFTGQASDSLGVGSTIGVETPLAIALGIAVVSMVTILRRPASRLRQVWHVYLRVAWLVALIVACFGAAIWGTSAIATADHTQIFYGDVPNGRWFDSELGGDLLIWALIIAVSHRMATRLIESDADYQHLSVLSRAETLAATGTFTALLLFALPNAVAALVRFMAVPAAPLGTMPALAAIALGLWGYFLRVSYNTFRVG